MFTKFLDTVLTFSSDVNKNIYQKKKHFFIEKSIRSYKYGMFSYHRFDFRPIGALTPNLDGEFSVAPRLNGYFEIVFFKKKPIIIIGQYALTNILNPESRDSTVYKLLNRNIQCKKCFFRPKGLPFYYYFKELGSAEKQFITGIVGESLTNLILQDYCNNSTQLEVFKNKRFLEDYDQFVKPPGFYDPSTQPHLKNISKIFSEKMSDNFLN